MTTDQLRAEAGMVQQESGGEMTTRAALLIGAADAIDAKEEIIQSLERRCAVLSFNSDQLKFGLLHLKQWVNEREHKLSDASATIETLKQIVDELRGSR